MISLPISVPSSQIINEHLSKNNITLSVLRLDLIHEEVSGNKLFKLHYFLKECLLSRHKTILTFGGAYSNHLAATAYACNQNKITCIGVIRGEEPTVLSHTLEQCKKYGMQLHFISREQYKNSTNASFINKLKNLYGDFILIPEGGFDYFGAKGASHIMNLIDIEPTTHICTSVGTATTLAGLLINNKNNISILALPAIKNMTDIDKRLTQLIGTYNKNNLEIIDEYHFGGYAKHNAELINFMNDFFNDHQIPTDIIYTSKLMFGVLDKIKNGFFANGSKIVCIHTGGLQGNKSLPFGTLNF